MSMKNLLNKMTQLSKLTETPKAPVKKILKESAPVAPAKPSSLKALFNELHEAIAPGQKPLPVMDPQNKTAGAGFVTSTNPAVQNMLKNLDPKDVQIVQAPGKPGQPMAPTAPGQAPAPGQVAVREVDMGQAEQGMHKSTPHTGGYQVVDSSGKVISKHKGQRDAMQAALKNDNYKVKAIKEGDLPSSSGVDNRGAGLGAGRNPTTFEGAESESKLDKKIQAHNRSIKFGRPYPSPHTMKDAPAGHKFDKQGMIVIDKNSDKKEPMKKPVDEGKKGVNPFAKKDDKAPAKAPAKGKKPDFLDLDKDGDKKEPMKKAAAQAKPGTKGVNPFAKTDDKKKKTVKEAAKDIPYDDPEMVKGREIQAYLHKEQAAKKAAADKQKKKTVKESMSHRMQAARLEGKAHGLKGHSHNGKFYEDMEEARCYHEGYKEGLDECYGMMPGQGLVGEAEMPAATTGGMATHAMPAMEDEVDEGNPFTRALGRTPKGDQFRVAGKTFTDTSNYDSQLDEFTFESLDSQLNALLNEGISVSISKGQENAPNSVTITAQDAEADELLALVKNAGMGGIFGNDEGSDDSFGMPTAPEIGGASEINAPGQIEVVDDHEGMLALMKKLAGNQSAAPTQDFGPQEAEPEEHDDNQGDMLSLMNKMSGDEEGSDDYEDEEGDSDEDESEECSSCGSADCECDDDEDKVDEDESEDEQEFEVAEDTGADNTDADVAGQVGSDEALATADAGEDEEEGMEDQAVQESEDDDEEDKKKKRDKEDAEPDWRKAWHDTSDELKEEEDLTEWANDAGGNGTETTFEQDIDFMTRVISGGLNKQKSTGQTTIPVIPGQKDRMGYSAVNESISDWAKLAGIKKN